MIYLSVFEPDFTNRKSRLSAFVWCIIPVLTFNSCRGINLKDGDSGKFLATNMMEEPTIKYQMFL